MCGFSAILCSDKHKNLDLLKKINNDLIHRGPDSGNIITENGYALVFRRLSIIDKSNLSDQPFIDQSKQYTIMFNGEIYNYKKLKKQLIQEGCLFKSDGDTEVILQGYMKWGLRIFNLIEGMFTIIIIDKNLKKALVVRDPIGIKPLYMTRLNPGIAFASEIKPLRRLVGTSVDISALSELLTFRYASGEKSNYKNIQKVKPGALIEINLDTASVKEKLFENTLSTFQIDNNLTELEWLKLLKDSLLESCKSHLQSDVGYTLQLSGGLDSSLITAMTSKITSKKLSTFSVKLDDYEYDESEWRNLIIQKYDLNHNEIHLSSQDFTEAWPEAVKVMEGPSPHFGCVMLMLLCKEISKESKVVLTGEGADEIFGGYARYKVWNNLKRIRFISQLFPNFFWNCLSGHEEYKKYNKYHPDVWSSCTHDFYKMFELFPELNFSGGYRTEVAERFSDFRTKMIAVDQKVYMDSLLLRQDKMAMASSVEARVPFCHLPLLKLANKIPNKIRVPGGSTKPLLKKIAESFLPNDLIYRRKVGLNLPLDNWLKNEKGLGRYLDLLVSEDSQLAIYGDKNKIINTVDKFKKGNLKDLPSLPILINVELWLRSILDPI